MPSRGRGEWHASVGATETVNRLAPANADDGEHKMTGGIACLRNAGETKVSLSQRGIVRKERPRLWINRHRSPNVKHQRARATASRVKDELSLRALRCMR